MYDYQSSEKMAHKEQRPLATVLAYSQLTDQDSFWTRQATHLPKPLECAEQPTRKVRHLGLDCTLSKPLRLVSISHDPCMWHRRREHCSVLKPVNPASFSLFPRLDLRRPRVIWMRADAMHGHDTVAYIFLDQSDGMKASCTYSSAAKSLCEDEESGSSRSTFNPMSRSVICRTLDSAVSAGTTHIPSHTYHEE